MKRDSTISALCLAIVLACGGLVLVAGIGAERNTAGAGVAACQTAQGCGGTMRHGWMQGEAARRFASVFRE